MKNIFKLLFYTFSITAISLLASSSGPNTSGSSGGGSGTVTNVDMSVPTLLSVSGNPVTTSGTLAVTYSGTALPVSNGGSGTTSLLANNVVLGNGTSAVNFVAPSTSGNVLTSNGTTWASTAAAGAALSGGIIDRLTKWTSSSAVSNSLWNEGPGGSLLFTNFSSLKGSKTQPLIGLNSGAAAAGLFTGTSNELNMCSGGALVFGLDSANANLYDASNSSNYLALRNLAGNATFILNGAGSQYIFTPVSGASNGRIIIQGANGENSLQMLAYPQAATSPGEVVFYNTNDIFLEVNQTPTGSSRGIGNAPTKLNALTVTADADDADVRGTTTVNASTTVTGSSTKFLTDFGIGDLVSVSSAASTYARVTAIASNTSMTVSAVLGNGTSQTMNKKQALLSLRPSTGTVQFEVDPNGRPGVSSAANKAGGTATCNGTTEVTVNNTMVSATTHISLSYLTPGSPTVAPFVSARSAGTSFGFKCTAADTTSTVSYVLTELLP